MFEKFETFETFEKLGKPNLSNPSNPSNLSNLLLPLRTRAGKSFLPYRETQTLVQGKSNPRTGKGAPLRRGERPSPQGNVPPSGGMDSGVEPHFTAVLTVTGFACTGLLSSSPALSAFCVDCVTTAMPGMPMA